MQMCLCSCLLDAFIYHSKRKIETRQKEIERERVREREQDGKEALEAKEEKV